MLKSAELLKQVRFVLVRPLYSGNIGSAARVIQNFGFSKLVLVRPPSPLGDDAGKMAMSGKTVLKRAERFDTVAEAVASDHVVMGTTRRLGHRRRLHYLSPEKACAMVKDVVASSRVSILFGQEDSGLSNDDLKVCHWLVNIPSPVPSNSLNLSHAVGVIAYELSKQLRSGGVYARATASHLEAFFQHFQTVLTQIGFLKFGDPRRLMMKFRHIFHRAALDEKEVKTLHGILSQVQWAMKVKKGIGQK